MKLTAKICGMSSFVYFKRKMIDYFGIKDSGIFLVKEQLPSEICIDIAKLDDYFQEEYPEYFYEQGRAEIENKECKSIEEFITSKFGKSAAEFVALYL